MSKFKWVRCKTREGWDFFPVDDFEYAIRNKWFADALDILTKSPSHQVKKLLRKGCYHFMDGLPVWHFLAKQRLKEEDKKYLQSILRYYIKCGYDINQTTDSYVAVKRASRGFTALHTAIERSNGVLLDVLLEPEFQVDINARDTGGFSPCHWAILVGDSRNLKKLINAGAVVKSTENETKGVDNVHPILHTAVDEGRSEIVFYLLNDSIADINEGATYQSIMTEMTLVGKPSRYNCEGSKVEVGAKATVELADVIFTPLSRAVRMRKIPIIEMLLIFGAKPTKDLSELHFCIIEGDSEVACMLMRTMRRYYSVEELANDRIGEMWALHCLHKSAYQDVGRVEKTKELIQEYVNCGWDVNAVSKIRDNGTYEHSDTGSQYFVVWDNCTLLHLACLNRSSSVVDFLLGIGANVNSLCKGISVGVGEVSLTPLLISTNLQDFQSVKLLVEGGADVMADGEKTCTSGSVELGSVTIRFYRQYKNCLTSQLTGFPTCRGSSNRENKCNAVERVLRFGMIGGGIEDILDLMLSKIDVGVNEMVASFDGGIPKHMAKILDKLGDQVLSTNLPRYIITPIGNEDIEIVPTFSFIMERLDRPWDFLDVQGQFGALGYVMEMFAKHGYDFNRDIDCNVGNELSMLRHVLLTDLQFQSTILTSTILKFDHVKINLETRGFSIVAEALEQLDCQCQFPKFCWMKERDPDYCSTVVKLLLEHGADVSALVIDNHLKYHFGYKDMMKFLVYMGATIRPSFFEDAVCHQGYPATFGFVEEITELREWVEKFKKASPNLQDICRLAIRKNFRTVRDLKILEELPQLLRKDVLGANFIM